MKKMIYVTLASLFVCGAFSACGETTITTTPDMPVKEAKTWEHDETTHIVYDCFGGDGNVMPILGYWNAPGNASYQGQFFPEMKNDDYFASVADAGINLIIQANDDAKSNDDVVERTLDYCDKYDIGYYVTDRRMFDADMLCNKKELLQRTEGYAQHKSFAGYYLKDEPNREKGQDVTVNSALKGFYEVANELEMNIHTYVTLFPYEIGQFNQDPENKYPVYVKTVFENTQAPFVMYDIYPLREDAYGGFGYEAFYKQLSLIRQASIEMNKAWVPYVSVSDEDNPGQEPDIFYYRMPTEGELSWQVNQYLAFGAKGISYFPMNSPLSFYDEVAQGDTVAMFDWKGNKTEVYYYVKEVNKQIHAIDEYLINATSHGVIFHGDIKHTDDAGKDYLLHNEALTGESFRELTSIDGDNATVGCFDYKGKTCLYVVNGSMEKDAVMTLRFDDRYAYTLIQRGQTANVKGSKINLSLSAGEAALIVLK